MLGSTLILVVPAMAVVHARPPSFAATQIVAERMGKVHQATRSGKIASSGDAHGHGSGYTRPRFAPTLLIVLTTLGHLRLSQPETAKYNIIMVVLSFFLSSFLSPLPFAFTFAPRFSLVQDERYRQKLSWCALDEGSFRFSSE